MRTPSSKAARRHRESRCSTRTARCSAHPAAMRPGVRAVGRCEARKTGQQTTSARASCWRRRRRPESTCLRGVTCQKHERQSRPPAQKRTDLGPYGLAARTARGPRFPHKKAKPSVPHSKSRRQQWRRGKHREIHEGCRSARGRCQTERVNKKVNKTKEKTVVIKQRSRRAPPCSAPSGTQPAPAAVPWKAQS